MQSAGINSVMVIGLGMIGGSIACGLRRHNPQLRIIAVDRDIAQLERAHKDGVIDAWHSDLAKLEPVDLLVLAVPVLATAGVLAEIAGQLTAQAVITDVASVKQEVIKVARQTLGARFRRFVPGHPIAGSEKSGYLAASAELFKKRKVILSPEPETDVDAVNLVHRMWHQLGADVLGMDKQKHDEVLAATSHLPHLLSYALVDTLLQQQRSEDIFRYAAGGFADFSRLASSDPTMWADIFVTNTPATLQVLDGFIGQLESLKQNLQQGRHAELKQQFFQAKQARDRFIRKFYHAMKSEQQEHQANVDYLAEPGGTANGEIRVPGDKSISHRAVIFGALAAGVTRVSGWLEGEDALNTLAAFREMGVTVVGPDQGQLTIYGVGMQGLQAPRKPLYMGNSGTAMRLLCGLLAAQPFASELTGDESLSRRPMRRVIDPLSMMGASIQATAEGTPPLKITGANLQGIAYDMPMASAQVKSCLLLAGLYARGSVTVVEPAPCRDHTERMLEGFGYPVLRVGNRVTVQGGGSLTATDIDVPADISSAAFFMVAAAISPGASLRLLHVGVNPTRTGIINLLRRMGADISLCNERVVGGEPVADVTVTGSVLHGIDIPADQIPLAIDEFPALFIAAACADGVTRLRGAEELRVKESDRIQAMADGLTTLGIANTVYADGIDITGGRLAGGTVDSLGDHRIAMSFAVAALRAAAPIRILNCANVATSFPGFVALANQAGIRLRQVASAGESA